MRAPSKETPNFKYEWAGLTLALLVFCLALASFDVLHRADLMFLDMASGFVHREAPRKVVLIAIDNRTVEQLGGWPLSRTLHAALIDRLTESGAAAVGFDLSTTRTASSTATSDMAFRDALKRNGKVALRIWEHRSQDFDTSSLPPAKLAEFADSSFGIGQMEFQRDEDGIVRGGFLLADGYPHLATLMLRAAGMPAAACAGESLPHLDNGKHCLRYVPLGRQHAHDTYSYIDVLQGRTPASALRGSLVVVGATADGVKARLATPSIEGASLYGAELLAETVNAAATSTLIEPAGFGTRLIFNVAALPLICLALLLLGPRASLFACVNIVIILIAWAYVSLRLWHVFIPPSAGALTCMLAYPLWAWLRQEELLRYLSVEAVRVMKEPSLPDDTREMRRVAGNILDPVERRLNAMTALIDRVRRYRELVSEWVDSLPEATLVVTADGKILLANARVAALSSASGEGPSKVPPPTGRAVSEVLFEITGSHRAVEYAARTLAYLRNWPNDTPSSLHYESLFAQGIEITDARASRSLLIKCAPILPSATRGGALIFHVADVTSVRIAERQRDITLRFLSHDMRSPQAAILALVEQMRQKTPRLTPGDFVDMVEQYATSALTLADDFLFLARAESIPPRLTEVDLALVLGDAIDDMWPQASARSTTVNLDAEPGRIVIADVQLLRRALGNLISNAIKYSPEGATVHIELTETARDVRVAIIDRGIGISQQEMKHLFRAFSQLDATLSRAGHGLGLAFVNTAVEALGGRMTVQSTPGDGATFTVILPRPDIAADEPSDRDALRNTHAVHATAWKPA